MYKIYFFGKVNIMKIQEYIYLKNMKIFIEEKGGALNESYR